MLAYFNNSEVVPILSVGSNDFTSSKEDKNKININEIYVRLDLVARVDLWAASYSIHEGAMWRHAS